MSVDCSDADLAETLIAVFARLDENQRWRRDALCREHPELDFFPGRGVSTAGVKAVCAQCLVRERCLDFAVADGTKFGIWGGLSERERRKVRATERVA